MLTALSTVSLHPTLLPTQIDIDSHTDDTAVAAELLSGSDEDSTAWRNGSWYTARLEPLADKVIICEGAIKAMVTAISGGIPDTVSISLSMYAA
jgi:hypothetical protein